MALDDKTYNGRISSLETGFEFLIKSFDEHKSYINKKFDDIQQDIKIVNDNVNLIREKQEELEKKNSFINGAWKAIAVIAGIVGYFLHYMLKKG